MATLQVRSIDDKLYGMLARTAKTENRSISRQVIAILKEHLAVPAESRGNATNAFLTLAGSWQDSRSAQDIVAEIRKSRATRRLRRTL